MRLFLDDFSVFSDLKKHLAKLWLCFDKCQEFNISLNMEKHIFWFTQGSYLGTMFPRWENYSIQKKIRQL
jgi:hypothetical protein